MPLLIWAQALVLRLEAALSVSLSFLLGYLFSFESGRLLEDYCGPGKLYCVKWILGRIQLWLATRGRIPRGRNHAATWKEGPEKFGLVASREDWKWEKAGHMGPDPQAVDEAIFYGISPEGSILKARISRRKNGRVEVIMFLKLDDGTAYLLPSHPSTECYGTDAGEFAAEGLRIQCLVPFQRWRVSFNGNARKQCPSSQDKEQIVHLRFSLLWSCTSEVYDYQTDYHGGLLADAFSRERWPLFGQQLGKTLHLQDRYEQWGQYFGTVTENNNEDKEVILWGVRARQRGAWKWGDIYHCLRICGFLKDGTVFHVGAVSVPCVVSNLRYGYIILPNHEMYPVDHCDINLGKLSQDEGILSKFTILFSAGGTRYRLQVLNLSSGWRVYGSPERDVVITGYPTKLTLNGDVGRGICEHYRRNTLLDVAVQKSYPPLLLEPEVPTKKTIIPLVVLLDDRLCQSSKVTGGKGASLALLTKLQKKTGQFVVPKGVVLTVASYRHHLMENAELARAITSLEKLIGAISLETLRIACQRVTREFSKTHLSQQVKSALVAKLYTLFASDLHSVRFAVRSSALGEDNKELSAAGQLETFLGLKGMDKVYSSIIQCWGSQFSFTSIQYKRQHGQAINEDIAVIVQEMVPAEVSGALVTCNPSTGDRKFMTISANYGLGESIVLGTSEPDTIVLQKTSDKSVVIHSLTKGSKETKIIMDEENGTRQETCNKNVSSQCCLPVNNTIQVGLIAMGVEQAFSSPRDIEWAIANRQVYLLQARPVTSLDLESEYELIHEFDHGLLTDAEYSSRANTGEVLPGALTPLTLSVVIQLHQQTGQTYFAEKGSPYQVFHRHFSDGSFISHWQIFILMVPFFFRLNERKVTMLSRSWELALFGRPLDESMDIRAQAIHRYGYTSQTYKMRNFVHILLDTLRSSRLLQLAKKRYYRYRIRIEKFLVARDLYHEITQRLTDFCQAFYCHISCTVSSTFVNGILLGFLIGDKTELTGQIYSDFSTLLSHCDGVESADIPSAIQDLAEEIASFIGPDVFSKMGTDEALRWLQEDRSLASRKFHNFLTKHGHRCLKEFDLASVPWGMEPRDLVLLLQAMMKDPAVTGRRRPAVASEPSILSQLKTTSTRTARFFLYLAVWWAKRGVRIRESSKSLLVKVLDSLRQGYRQLGHLMVVEGRLPDPELIFYFTHDEIGQILETRSAKLLSKAVRRRKLFKKVDSLQFPEIICGPIHPISETLKTEERQAALVMKGTPVCCGTTTGIARVVPKLKDALSIQPGDILITHSTDIGWTPYFPLLSGLVTEVGGLISHGAVVAREYGLPCIVGVRTATAVFQSGDVVELDGTRGIIRKLEPTLEMQAS